MSLDIVFANLISPVSVEEFFSDHWEKKPMFLSRGERGFYDYWLTLPSLDRYFRSGHLSPNFLRVVKNGVDCELNGWTIIEQRKNTEPYRIAVADKLFSLFDQGATIIVNAAQTAIDGLNSLSVGLENELGIKVQTNVYLSPPMSQGFSPHFDIHDVLILQTSGSKNWRLYDRAKELPISDEPLDPREYADREPSHVFEMSAGDLLYIPRGTVHVANTASVSSVHVTVALMFRHWIHLFEDLVLFAQKEEAFRQALPHRLSTSEERADFSVRFKQRLLELLANVDVNELSERRIADSDHAARREDRVSELFKVDELTPGSIVTRETESKYAIEKNEQNVTIDFGGGVLELPAFLGPTVASMMNSEPYAIRELKGPLSEAGKVELVRKFVRAGILRIVTI